MKILLPNKPAGIAIIIVMVSIFVLSLLAGAFAMHMKVETKLAANSNNENDLEWLGRSGIEMARYALGQQMKIPSEPYDSLNQMWAGGSGDTNGLLADIKLKDYELGNGKISVRITDAERKFNVNVTPGNEDILQKGLILIGVDAADMPTIIASIEDWIDRDDDTHINGAEKDYYLSLDPPYQAKNGPVDDLSELLLVKGVSPEIYWGPNATNHPAPILPPAKGLTPSGILPPGASLSPAGLVDILTAISNGKINVNTASATQLQLIPGVDENIAGEIMRFRAGPDGVDGTEDDQPFRSLGDLVVNTSLGQRMLPVVSRLATVRSSTFEVEVDVEMGRSRRTYYSTLVRNAPNDVQVLNLHWKE